VSRVGSMYLDARQRPWGGTLLGTLAPDDGALPSGAAPAALDDPGVGRVARLGDGGIIAVSLSARSDASRESSSPFERG